MKESLQEDWARYLEGHESFSVYRYASIISKLADNKVDRDYATLVLLLFEGKKRHADQDPMKRLKGLAHNLAETMKAFSDKASEEAKQAWQAHALQCLWAIFCHDIFEALATRNGVNFSKAIANRNSVALALLTKVDESFPQIPSERFSAIRAKELELAFISRAINWNAVFPGADEKIVADMEKVAARKFDKTIMADARKRLWDLKPTDTDETRLILTVLSPKMLEQMFGPKQAASVHAICDNMCAALTVHCKYSSDTTELDSWLNTAALISDITASHAQVLCLKMVEEYSKSKPDRAEFDRLWKERGQWIQVRIKFGFSVEGTLSQLEERDKILFPEYWDGDSNRRSSTAGVVKKETVKTPTIEKPRKGKEHEKLD